MCVENKEVMIVGRPDRGANGFVFVFYYPCLFLEFKKLIAGAGNIFLLDNLPLNIIRSGDISRLRERGLRNTNS